MQHGRKARQPPRPRRKRLTAARRPKPPGLRRWAGPGAGRTPTASRAPQKQGRRGKPVRKNRRKPSSGRHAAMPRRNDAANGMPPSQKARQGDSARAEPARPNLDPLTTARDARRQAGQRGSEARRRSRSRPGESRSETAKARCSQGERRSEPQLRCGPIRCRRLPRCAAQRFRQRPRLSRPQGNRRSAATAVTATAPASPPMAPAGPPDATHLALTRSDFQRRSPLKRRCLTAI